MALAFAFRYVAGSDVVEPVALRERLIAVAHQALQRYAGNAGGIPQGGPCDL